MHLIIFGRHINITSVVKSTSLRYPYCSSAMENPPEMCNTCEHAVQTLEHTRNKNDPPVVSKICIFRPFTDLGTPPPKGLENRYFTCDVAE